MDSISTILRSVRAGSVNARRVRKAGSWGTRYSGFAGSGFHVITHGTGWLITGSTEPVPLMPGDAVLIPAGAEHGLSPSVSTLAELPADTMVQDSASSGKADFVFLCGAYRLAHGRVHPCLQTMPEAVVLPADRRSHRRLHSLIDLLAEDVADEEPVAEVARRALLDLVLAHILLRWDEQTPVPAQPVMVDPAITAALQMIHSDPAGRFTVQQLSAAAGLSRTAFSRRFAFSLGTSPTAYLVSQRLAHGAQLLVETPAPLAAVAHQVGYATEFAFSAAFRREYGVSPGRFRRL